MSKDIRIKKGLNISLIGEAEQTTTQHATGGFYAIKPSDFHGITVKLIAKEGAEVKAGEPLFYSKSDERILFPSPVSGKVTEVIRGERRKVLAINIAANATQEFKDFGTKDAASMSAEEVKNHLLASGCWPFVKQRPYDVVANPNQAPKAIFVSAYASAPLAADLDYTLKGKEAELQAALMAVGKLTEGKLHVSVGKSANSPFSNLKGIEIHKVSGPHPIGNVGTQIAQIDPINKGEVVWVITPQDLVVIGELLLTGKFNITRTVALTGSQFRKPHYVTVTAGAKVATIVKGNLDNDNTRIISGNVLSGNHVKEEGFIEDFEIYNEDLNKTLLLSMKYKGSERAPVISKIKRVSKPGLRIYSNTSSLPIILGNLGIAIISTSQGLMTNIKARELGIGGEVLCYIW